MIVFELTCAEAHRFEGWFASAEAFESQRRSGLVSCPACGSAAIDKVPSARIRRAGPAGPPAAVPAKSPDTGPRKVTLAAFVDHVLRHTEDVGERFPDEARKIHYEEAPQRGIRGVASREESEALAEEGIAVLPLPIPSPEEWH
jgi:hypothetical protein